MVIYYEDYKGYCIYVLSLKDVVVSRDIIFKTEKLLT